MLVTYTFALSGRMATHHGSMPTATSATFTFASLATLKTATELLSGLTLHTSAPSLVIAIGLECVDEMPVWAVATRGPLPVQRSPAFQEPPTAIAPRTRSPSQTEIGSASCRER